MIRKMSRALVSAVLAVMVLTFAQAGAGELFPDKTVKMIYVINCAECHGGQAEGSMDGPPLANVEFLTKSGLESILKIINKGVSGKDKRFPPEKLEAEMPGFSGDLTKDEAKALASLVKSWNK